jgi:hypothetical protein
MEPGSLDKMSIKACGSTSQKFARFSPARFLKGIVSTGLKSKFEAENSLQRNGFKKDTFLSLSTHNSIAVKGIESTSISLLPRFVGSVTRKSASDNLCDLLQELAVSL